MTPLNSIDGSRPPGRRFAANRGLWTCLAASWSAPVLGSRLLSMRLLPIRMAGLGLAVLLLGAGCITSPVAVAPSTHPITAGMEVTNLGPASGRASLVTVMGIPLSSPHPTETALRKAINSKAADALLALTVESHTVALPLTMLPLVNVVTVCVHGEAIKLSE